MWGFPNEPACARRRTHLKIKGEHMKKIFTLFLFCVVLVGCRGRTGKDGTGGGEMQSFTGVTDVDGFGVQVNNFGDLDEVTAYYALASAPHDFFELKGPDTAMTTAPYYAPVSYTHLDVYKRQPSRHR